MKSRRAFLAQVQASAAATEAAAAEADASVGDNIGNIGNTREALECLRELQARLTSDPSLARASQQLALPLPSLPPRPPNATNTADAATALQAQQPPQPPAAPGEGEGKGILDPEDAMALLGAWYALCPCPGLHPDPAARLSPSLVSLSQSSVCVHVLPGMSIIVSGNAASVCAASEVISLGPWLSGATGTVICTQMAHLPLTPLVRDTDRVHRLFWSRTSCRSCVGTWRHVARLDTTGSHTSSDPLPSFDRRPGRPPVHQ